MSNLRIGDVLRVIAILCSDLHFSHTAPVARSAEPDWYQAQLRPILEIKDLLKKHDVPVICSGDIFDRWSSPPELINFLIDNLPSMYAVPGQHDLSQHVYADMNRTSYGTLVRAGKIRNLLPGIYPNTINSDLEVWAFPWNHALSPCVQKVKGRVNLAVIHSYIWKEGCGYPGAPTEKKAGHYKPKLEGYDAAVFGDNHQGFMLGKHVINCGTLMCRKSDERHYRPQIGLLFEDGHIEPHCLDVSKDLWLEEPLAEAKELQELDTSSFITELKELGQDSLDFVEALKRNMDIHQIGEDVRRTVLETVSR